MPSATERRPTATVRRVPLVVVGGGPAGVAAACAAIEARVPVVLIDRGELLGGRSHRHAPAGSGTAAPSTPDRRRRRWDADVARLARSPRFTHVAAAGVWAAQRLRSGGVLLATDREDLPAIEADTIVVANGAMERVVPFPGWDLPGVHTLGDALALAHDRDLQPDRTVVVAGAGPLLVPVAAALARGRTDIAALADANDPRWWSLRPALGLRITALREQAADLATLARHGVPLRARTAVIAARGDGRVEEVILARLRPDWTPILGSEEVIAADALATSHGLVPDVSLALALGCRITAEAATPSIAVDAWQATGVPGVWAAGEVTGVGGPDVAEHEGRVAGLAAARSLGARIDDRALERAVALRRSDASTLRDLARAHPMGDGWTTWLTADTVVCPCEQVTRGTIDDALTRRSACELACDVRSIALMTGCATGRCQGRRCTPTVAGLVTVRTGRAPGDAGMLDHRPILHPIPLGRV